MLHSRPSTDQREQGFTLIELLVVIVIIGILAAIAIPVWLNQRTKGVDASLRADLKNAATAAETWGSDNPSAATFGADAATIRANLAAAGLKVTPGNRLSIKGGPNGGFCIAARSDGGTTPAGTWFFYDSNLGGVQAAQSTGGPQTAGAACHASAGMFTTVV